MHFLSTLFRPRRSAKEAARDDPVVPAPPVAVNRSADPWFWSHFDDASSIMLDDFKRHLIAEYENLNRITAEELRHFVVGAGFEILSARVFKVEGMVPDKRLLQDYSLDLLLTNQIVLVARRSPSDAGDTSHISKHTIS